MRFAQALLYSLIGLVLFTGQASGQQWVKRYNAGTTTREWGIAVTTDPQGNVYATGWTNPAGTYN